MPTALRGHAHQRDNRIDCVPLLARPAAFLPGPWINPALLDEQAVAPGGLQLIESICRIAALFVELHEGKPQRFASKRFPALQPQQ